MSKPDIYNIDTPFGLLDEATREALEMHDGPVEIYNGVGEWIVVDFPKRYIERAYRAVRKPERETVKVRFESTKLVCDIAIDLVNGEPDWSTLRKWEDAE